MNAQIPVVILCGGLGTRLSEETQTKPKPMVEIGGKPIIYHLIKYFEFYGFNNFLIAAGYKKEIIDAYFKKEKFNSTITVVDTGNNSMTGGRVLRIEKYIKNNDFFILTYGDGLSNINLKDLITFHLEKKKIATITAVHPPARFGELEINEQSEVKNFIEKPQVKAGWINGGFFVLSNKIFKYIDNDATIFEKEPIEKLVKEKEISAFKHEGFWKCMDTLRDKISLNEIWNEGDAPWKK
tara:strand:- start:110 stop:826 length:717 start_codon:yes stop_codon:yes gene_type:complete